MTLAEKLVALPLYGLIDEHNIRALHARLALAVELLTELSRRHEGWEHGMGACVCAEHEAIRAALPRLKEAL